MFIIFLTNIKIRSKRKKVYLYKIPEHLKGYMFIGEYPDEEITKIESQNVTFLKNEFPSSDKIDKEIQLYELNEVENKKPKSFDSNGSNYAPQDEPSQNSQIQKSTHLSIPRRHFLD